MEDLKIVIVASRTIDLIDYSNILDLKAVFSSNFEENLQWIINVAVSDDKKLMIIINVSKLIFVDSSNLQNITLIKTL